MTRYSRSVIPGRPRGEEGGTDIDRLVFGKGGDKSDADASPGDGDPDFLPPAEVGDLIERANSDRRKGKRRKTDFAPLPEEGRAFKADEGAKRGPMLLVGALVIVAVFGVVVWNAYRDGVKPENSDSAIELASAGSFKSKPEDGKARADGDVQAGVFDQIEKTKPLAAPAPEVRETPTAAVVPPPLAGGPTKSEPAKVGPVKAEAAKAEAKPATPAPTPVKIGPPAQVKTASNPPPAAAAVPPPKPAATPPSASAPLPVSPAVAKAVAKAEPKADTPEAEPVVATSGDFKPAFSKDGGYVVQVAAPSTPEGAEAEWAKRAKAAPDLFGTAEKIIVKADVNGRTVYRLRAGSFATPADAEAFCTAYKAKGGACFRTAK